MHIVRSLAFLPAQSWESVPVATGLEGAARLHWADSPRDWRAEDGLQTLVVLAGSVEVVCYGRGNEETVVLGAGDVLQASLGCAHRVTPRVPAHLLVVERAR